MITCTGCDGAASERTLFAMDTYIHLTVYGDGLDEAAAEIERLDGLFSKSEENSDISKINAAGGQPVEVSKDTVQIIKRGLDISSQTEGMFDIEIYPLTKLWDFKSDSPALPDKQGINTALTQDKLTVIDGTTVSSTGIDIGGIGKGYTAARVRKILKNNSVTSAVVSLGGNVMLYGSNPNGDKWSVGIQHPVKDSEIIGKIYAEDTSVVTSGGYQRYFEIDGKVYHHILDSRTGYPADSGIISATVISRDDTLADALATALYVKGVESSTQYWLENYAEFDMILVTEDSVYITAGIADSFELCDSEYKLYTLQNE